MPSELEALYSDWPDLQVVRFRVRDPQYIDYEDQAALVVSGPQGCYAMQDLQEAFVAAVRTTNDVNAAISLLATQGWGIVPAPERNLLVAKAAN